MIEFLIDYGLFFAKTVTIVIAVMIIAAGIIGLSMRSQGKNKEQIEVKNLNQRYEDMALALQAAILPKKSFKQTLKASKKERKKEPEKTRPRLFVIDFKGDIRASSLNAMREEITAILTVAGAEDEVLVRLESAGGLVHAYGLAASQLDRIRQKGIKLTVAVDKVAASGGYMMACIADHIIAAPFAVLGSIGVLAQLPNFNRLLKKNHIDFEQFTAGEFKRTVTIFGENNDRDREKFQEDLEDTHALFKAFVKAHREELDIDAVATGEHWYGTRAKALNLIDELSTSDDYLLTASKNSDLYQIIYNDKKALVTRLFALARQALNRGYADTGNAGIERRML